MRLVPVIAIESFFKDKIYLVHPRKKIVQATHMA